MAHSVAPILSIAIPTYNRAPLLDRALQSIKTEVGDKIDKIEIIVSNNCSTDHTDDVVNKHIAAGLPINYIVNTQNMGADFNIMQCYKTAKGDFVVVFGDDDMFNKGAIQSILTVLNKFDNAGVFYLNWKIDNVPDNKQRQDEFCVFDNYEDFFQQISHNITFISGNVVNRKFIENLNLNTFIGSNLIQLPLLMDAAFKASYNIIHTRPLVSVKADNSGGFSVCKVFGQNLQTTLQPYEHIPQQLRVINGIKTRLLIECFPSWIYRIKTQKHTFTDTDLSKTLTPVYKLFTAYWLFSYPVIISSATLINFLWPLYRIYLSVLRRIMMLFKTNKGKVTKIKYQTT